MFLFLFYCTAGTQTLSVITWNFLSIFWLQNLFWALLDCCTWKPFHEILEITVMLWFQKIIIISCHWQFNCISIFNSLYWLQQFPVVPLFGDVQIALVSYLKMCPNFEGMREKWTAAADGADDKVVDQYNLLRRMDSIREEHVKFISELARYRNEVSIVAKPCFLK